jgi:hypothetical protein
MLDLVNGRIKAYVCKTFRLDNVIIITGISSISGSSSGGSTIVVVVVVVAAVVVVAVAVVVVTWACEGGRYVTVEKITNLEASGFVLLIKCY